MRRWGNIAVCVGLSLLAAGCPKKGQTDYGQGRKAESLQDYDTAFNYYQKALQSEPNNTDYKIKFDRARFEAGAYHVKKGQQLRDKGNLQLAFAEFQRAQSIDPSSPIAEQEARRTAALLEEQAKMSEGAGSSESEGGQPPLASAPPELKPLSRAPINLKMPNVDAKLAFDAIAKLAGLTVIYDPDFAQRRISTELNNVTLEQALEIVTMQSKTFWKPVTENVIFIIPDQAQKRRDYEEEIVRTFYLSNITQTQELTEIVTGLRTLVDIKKVQQINAQNAIIVRDTPDKVALAEKLIHDVDKAKPEVIVDVQILEARLDKQHNLGINPGTSASVSIVNPSSTTSSGSSSTTNTLTLENLRHLNGGYYSLTLPSLTANALLTDSSTKILQNPQLRGIDGQSAKLKIGDRVPIATGSYQAGVGVSTTTAVNALVNTQFQYQDVGVKLDITPRVHSNHEVSLKISGEVSSVTGSSTIGGISQPIISQRTIDHEVRLKEGEVNVLGGLITRTDTKSLSGWPGLAHIPLLRYFFSSELTEHAEDEILIVLTPHIIRTPDWTKTNLRPMYSGTESNVQVRRESDLRTPTPPAPQGQNPAAPGAPGTGAAPGTTPAPAANPSAQTGAPARLRFDQLNFNLKVGEQKTVALLVDNVTDLFSIPLLLQYDPAVISVEEVQHGDFLSGGTQEIALVQQVNKERGQAIVSATRQPNTQGVNGSGTLMGIVIKAIGPGSTKLSIVQVNAKDSQQKTIPLVTGETSIQVQP